MRINTPYVISLCDYTGNMVQPWVDAGYTAVLVDPQHLVTRQEGRMVRLAGTIIDVSHILGDMIENRAPSFVAGFPPCTDLAGSGAPHFARKYHHDPMFQAKAVAVAEQCRMIGIMSGAPYFVENPVGMLSNVFGKPDHIFHPYEYTGYDPADNYTKKTCLWVGNEFVMPRPLIDMTLGDPDNRIHTASPGPDRENFRSATPMGFARAVYLSNGKSV